MTQYQTSLRTWIGFQVRLALCDLGIISVAGYETEFSTLVESYTALIFEVVKDMAPAVNQKALDDFGLAINTKIKNHIAEMDRARYTKAREEKRDEEFKGIQGPDGLVLRMVPGPLTQQ